MQNDIQGTVVQELVRLDAECSMQNDIQNTVVPEWEGSRQEVTSKKNDIQKTVVPELEGVDKKLLACRMIFKGQWFRSWRERPGSY